MGWATQVWTPRRRALRSLRCLALHGRRYAILRAFSRCTGLTSLHAPCLELPGASLEALDGLLLGCKQLRELELAEDWELLANVHPGVSTLVWLDPAPHPKLALPIGHLAAGLRAFVTDPITLAASLPELAAATGLRLLGIDAQLAGDGLTAGLTAARHLTWLQRLVIGG